MSDSATTLELTTRVPGHSRATRRLRREGLVPGVVYGGDGEAIPVQVGERELRHALAGAGAVVDVTVDGGSSEPVILKDAQRHPVRGEVLHVDLLRVDLKKAIQSTTHVELIGGDDAPGVIDGGVLQQLVSELTIEARPNDIPASVQVDVSGLGLNESVHLSAITPPEGVTFLDDPDETTLATITPPRIRGGVDESAEGEEIETETEVVGEGAEAEGGEESE